MDDQPLIMKTPDLSTLTPSELRRLIERADRIFNIEGYGFWEWNLETDVITWSGNPWKTFGYDDSDLALFSTSKSFAQFIHADDLAVLKVTLRLHLKMRGPISCSYRMLAKDNDYHWMQVKADSILDKNDRVKFISGINFDISELKMIESALRESESRQSRIIDASNDGIWEWYAEKDDFHFSSRCWEHLGYSGEDNLPVAGAELLNAWRNHIHPDDLATFDRALKDHLMGQGPLDLEYRMFNKQGNIRWIHARGRASFDREGKPFRMSGTNIDITDFKDAEERAVKAKEVAEKANLAKSDFLSSMSHELRTPLNAIIGYAQLFEYDENLKSNQKDNIQEILKGGEHLLKLINDVLDLAKIESGNMKTQLQATVVSRLVTECITLLQPQADVKGIFLHANVTGFEQTCVMADTVRLKQALLNLMSNAIKYNHVGGEVKVTIMQQSVSLRVSVKDTGVGIAANRQTEVFQPFNRLHAEMSNIEGTGVGLVITRQLIEMMNGVIGFESKEGVGTHFWFDFPICDGFNKQERFTQKLGSAKKSPVLNISKPCHVLYIEDNPTNIRLLQQFFRRFNNFTLSVAEEPYVGIYKAREFIPDIIILDINLPGLDGFEVLNILQKDPTTKGIPVVALSANAMSFDVSKGRDAGFYEYLTKPVNIGKMVSVLNELFDRDKTATARHNLT